MCFRYASRLIALVLHLQQARIFEEISTQAWHLEWAQKGQTVPSVGEESSKCSTCRPSKEIGEFGISFRSGLRTSLEIVFSVKRQTKSEVTGLCSATCSVVQFNAIDRNNNLSQRNKRDKKD